MTRIPDDARSAQTPRETADVPGRSSIDATYLRAENEDDDGYDPYSDRIEHTPLFEEDPWD